MAVSFSTTVHYWRTPVSRWEEYIDRLSSAGLEGIDVYVPWGAHEREAGRFDFGESDPSLDLPRFLQLIADRGLWVLLRPGPQVNAELINFGLPDRIVRDERMQAHSQRGRPVYCPSPPVFFPIPSYASESYHEEVRRWLLAVGEAVRPVLDRGGAVRMVQVDNEASLFFREAPFDQDYRPEAVRLWDGWLDERGLPAREPPRRRIPGTEGLRTCMAWVRFRQWMVLRAIRLFSGYLEEAGLGDLPTYHNLPPSGLCQPLRHRDLGEAVDIVTTDIYAGVGRLANVRDQVLRLRGHDDEPFAAEMSCGTVFFAPGIGEFDNRFVTAASLAYGLKGFNLYMGVGRNRWIGGLIPEGADQEGADLLHFYQRLIRLLGTLGWSDMTSPTAAAVVVPEEYRDHSLTAFPLAAASPAIFSSLGMPLNEFLVMDEWGLGRPVQVQWLPRVRAGQDRLAAHGLPYVMTDGRDAPAGDAVLLVPTFRYLSAQVLGHAIDHATRGGTVIAGPERPDLDEWLEPHDPGLLEGWDRAVESGRLLCCDAPDEPAAKRALDEASHGFTAQLPWEMSIRSPGAEIWPQRSADGETWLCWVVCREGSAGSRTVLAPRKGWHWSHGLAIREGRVGGEFVRESGAAGEALSLPLSDREIHLVVWRK